MTQAWQFDDSSGSLHVHTDVDGRAARLGHRLTIAVQTWRAEVQWAGNTPAAVTLSADLTSISVERGDGGVTPLTGPEKVVARSNALKTLAVQRYPEVTFAADTVTQSDPGYRLAGTLQIHGRSRPYALDVTVTDDELTVEAPVRQSDFDIKPFSMMLGALQVADTVTVRFSAPRPQHSM